MADGKACPGGALEGGRAGAGPGCAYLHPSWLIRARKGRGRATGVCALPPARQPPTPVLGLGRGGGKGGRSDSASSLLARAQRGAGGGGSVSHGDSRFRCRKGGSAGGGSGEEARLFTRLKRARGCVPRLPGTCLSLPAAEAL